MSEKLQDGSPSPVEDPREHYEVCIEGHLEPGWAEWFGGLALTHLECGETLLCGPVADQAALHGIWPKSVI